LEDSIAAIDSLPPSEVSTGIGRDRSRVADQTTAAAISASSVKTKIGSVVELFRVATNSLSCFFFRRERPDEWLDIALNS
jgi:hypothetical protein